MVPGYGDAHGNGSHSGICYSADHYVKNSGAGMITDTGSASSAAQATSSNSHDASNSGSRRRHRAILKCSQCRLDKQRCTPVDRIWPRRCDRCIKYNHACSVGLNAREERRRHTPSTFSLTLSGAPSPTNPTPSSVSGSYQLVENPAASRNQVFEGIGPRDSMRPPLDTAPPMVPVGPNRWIHDNCGVHPGPHHNQRRSPGGTSPLRGLDGYLDEEDVENYWQYYEAHGRPSPQTVGTSSSSSSVALVPSPNINSPNPESSDSWGHHSPTDSHTTATFHYQPTGLSWSLNPGRPRDLKARELFHRFCIFWANINPLPQVCPSVALSETIHTLFANDCRQVSESDDMVNHALMAFSAGDAGILAGPDEKRQLDMFIWKHLSACQSMLRQRLMDGWLVRGSKGERSTVRLAVFLMLCYSLCHSDPSVLALMSQLITSLAKQYPTESRLASSFRLFPNNGWRIRLYLLDTPDDPGLVLGHDTSLFDGPRKEFEEVIMRKDVSHRSSAGGEEERMGTLAEPLSLDEMHLRMISARFGKKSLPPIGLPLPAGVPVSIAMPSSMAEKPAPISTPEPSNLPSVIPTNLPAAIFPSIPIPTGVAPLSTPTPPIIGQAHSSYFDSFSDGDSLDSPTIAMSPGPSVSQTGGLGGIGYFPIPGLPEIPGLPHRVTSAALQGTPESGPAQLPVAQALPSGSLPPPIMVPGLVATSETASVAVSGVPIAYVQGMPMPMPVQQGEYDNTYSDSDVPIRVREEHYPPPARSSTQTAKPQTQTYPPPPYPPPPQHARNPHQPHPQSQTYPPPPYPPPSQHATQGHSQGHPHAPLQHRQHPSQHTHHPYHRSTPPPAGSPNQWN